MARLNFRSGIVRHQTDINNNPTFLQRNGQFVNLVVSPDMTTITTIQGTKDYLYTEPASISQAWGPFTTGQDYWLYWDINRVTGLRTFGYTVIEPRTQPSAPTSPLIGMMWFNTTTNNWSEFNGAAWTLVLRVFACKYENAVTFISMSQNSPLFTGTQVGLNVNANSGSLVFDKTGKPLINQDLTFFTTEDVFTAGVPTGASLKVNNILIRALADEPLHSFQVVMFNNYNHIVHADPFAFVAKIYGIVEEDSHINEVVNVITSGVIFNEAWDWTAAGGKVNDPVYINLTGQIQLNGSIPNQSPVGGIIDNQSIIFDPNLFGEEIKDVILDHGALLGLDDDDHPQYHDDTRGDIRYYLQPVVDSLLDQKLNLSGGAMSGALFLDGLPSQPTQAATKEYVDNLISGLNPKEAVRVGTLVPLGGNYNPSGGLTGNGGFENVDLSDIDGITDLKVGDRILVKNQLDQKQNGLYGVTVPSVGSPAVGQLSRTLDFDGNPSNEISPGNYVFIHEGITQAGQGWLVEDKKGDESDINVNVDDIVWVLVSAGRIYQAGTNISITTGDFINVAPQGPGSNLDADTWDGQDSEFIGIVEGDFISFDAASAKWINVPKVNPNCLLDGDGDTHITIGYSPDDGYGNGGPCDETASNNIMVEAGATDTVGDITIKTNTGTSQGRPGGSITMQTADGSSVNGFGAAGGNIVLQSGDSTVDVDGSFITIASGNAINGNGGNVLISAGLSQNANGGDITLRPGQGSVSGGVVNFPAAATGSSAILKLFNVTNTNAISLSSPTGLSSNIDFVLPPNTGILNQLLTTDGNGVTSWTTLDTGSSNCIIDNDGDTHVTVGYAPDDGYGNGGPCDDQNSHSIMMEASSYGTITIQTLMGSSELTSGGDISILTGDGQTEGASGAINISTGVGVGSASGGDINLNTGYGPGNGGSINLTAGNGNLSGGDVILKAGDNNVGTVSDDNGNIQLIPGIHSNDLTYPSVVEFKSLNSNTPVEFHLFSNNGNKTIISSAKNLVASPVFVFPPSTGTTGQLLSTTGGSNATTLWVDPPSGGGSSTCIIDGDSDTFVTVGYSSGYGGGACTDSATNIIKIHSGYSTNNIGSIVIDTADNSSTGNNSGSISMYTGKGNYGTDSGGISVTSGQAYYNFGSGGNTGQVDIKTGNGGKSTGDINITTGDNSNSEYAGFNGSGNINIVCGNANDGGRGDIKLQASNNINGYSVGSTYGGNVNILAGYTISSIDFSTGGYVNIKGGNSKGGIKAGNVTIEGGKNEWHDEMQPQNNITTGNIAISSGAINNLNNIGLTGNVDIFTPNGKGTNANSQNANNYGGSGDINIQCGTSNGYSSSKYGYGHSGSVNIEAGDNTGSANAGHIKLSAGNILNTDNKGIYGQYTYGGDITLNAGAANSTAGSGYRFKAGDVRITSGSGLSGATTGSIYLDVPTNASGKPGNIRLQSGHATGSYGGNVSIFSGNSTASNYNNGYIALRAGSTQSTTDDPNSIRLECGYNTVRSTSGSVEIYSAASSGESATLKLFQNTRNNNYVGLRSPNDISSFRLVYELPHNLGLEGYTIAATTDGVDPVNLTMTEIPYDITAQAIGVISDGDIILRFPTPRKIYIIGTNADAEGFVGNHVGFALTAPTTDATFVVEQLTANGGSVEQVLGNIIFNSGSSLPVNTILTTTMIPANRIIQFRCTTAGGIEDVSITLQGRSSSELN